MYMWCTVAIALLLYYIFLRELQFKYDPLTSLRNRYEFEKWLKILENEDKVSIIVLDLNNLKKLNDAYGHRQGDEICIFCINISNETIEEIIQTFTSKVQQLGVILDKPYSVAIGYATRNIEETIEKCFSRADAEMYNNKMSFKKQEQCRKVEN